MAFDRRFQINQVGMSEVDDLGDPLKTDGSGRLLSKSSIVNNAGTVINPATEDKQDNSITHLATIAGDTTSLDGKDFATSAKQDTIIGHIDDVEGILTTINADTGSILTNQTDGSQKTQVVDASGNVINSNADANGDYSLGVSAIQNIITSTNNSTTDNLTAGATFTGTADEMLGVSGIQLFHASDQECTIYIDQSIDNTFADLTQTVTDSFTCLADTPCSRTYISVAPYYRLRVTNNGASATTKLSSFTGMTPIINPLPRSLSEYGRLMAESSLTDDVTSIRAKIAPFGKLKVVNPTRTIGTSFGGTTKDTNFWTETVTGSGSVTQAGQITLDTGTTADSTVKYQSVRKSRHVSGAANEFKFTGRLTTDPQANNIRRCGVYDGATGVSGDGFFFQVNGTTFGVGSRKGGTDTIVSSGSFNGDYGPSLSMDTSMGNFVIWWWEKVCYFFINGKLLHKINATTASLVNTNTLYITMENINSGGNTTDNGFEILTASVFRLGSINTESTYKFIGTNSTNILKYGAGRLRRILNVDNAGTTTIYDNTAASGTQIAVIDTAKSLGTLDFEVPFSNGLTVVTSSGAKVVVVYE